MRLFTTLHCSNKFTSNMATVTVVKKSSRVWKRLENRNNGAVVVIGTPWWWTLWGRWNRETWHRETWQSGTISQGWTLRDLTKRHHIARVDIARPDKTAPYRKGGHRETWQDGTRSNSTIEQSVLVSVASPVVNCRSTEQRRAPSQRLEHPSAEEEVEHAQRQEN